LLGAREEQDVGKKIAVVLPTKNEEKSIRQVIGALHAELARLGHEVVVTIVTDDSRDQTRKIAAECGAVVVNGGGKGLGLAMFRGLKTALQYSPDIIMSCDSDGQSVVSEAGSFLKPILAGDADMVLGSRFQEQGSIKYQYRLKNRTGIFILVRILRYLTRLPLTDSHGGLRAMVPQVIEELEMIGSHTYVQETIIDAAEKGFRIAEIPSVWEKREVGESRVVSSIKRYVFYTLPILFIRSGEHIKTLYDFGIFFIVLSLVHLGVVLLETHFNLKLMFDRQSFHLMGIFFLIGIQLFFCGFVLELLSGIKKNIDFVASRTLRK
jgi:glycosyltransferase involved in cell wall biosynthesis